MMGSTAMLLGVVQARAAQAGQGETAGSAQGEDFLAALDAALPLAADAQLPTSAPATSPQPADSADEPTASADMASVVATLLQSAVMPATASPPDASAVPTDATETEQAQPLGSNTPSAATHGLDRQLGMLLAKDSAAAASASDGEDLPSPAPLAPVDESSPATQAASPQPDDAAVAAPQALRQLLQMLSPSGAAPSSMTTQAAAGYADTHAMPDDMQAVPMEALRATALSQASEADVPLVTRDPSASAPAASADALPDAALLNLASPAQAAPQARNADAPAPQVLHSPVGTPRWADELGSRIAMMSLRGQHEGSLNLTPEHLGPLEVRISVSQDTANVWFGSQHADTRAALTDALPRLRELLADAGLMLGQANVSQQAPRQGARGNEATRLQAAASGEPAAVEATAPAARRVALGLVDTYA